MGGGGVGNFDAWDRVGGDDGPMGGGFGNFEA